MLLKVNPAVTKLNLYDIMHTPRVAGDYILLNENRKSVGKTFKIF